MIGTTGRRGRTTGIARRAGRGGPALLGIALVLATAACDSSESEPPAQAAPSATTAAAGGPTPAPSAGSPTEAPSPSAVKCGSDETVRVLGHVIKHDIIYVSVEDGSWDCADAAAPRWTASGAEHDVRVEETAEVSVARPFNSSATARPIELARFLEQIDAVADRSADPLVFTFGLDPSDGSLIRLTQDQGPNPTG